MTYLKLQLQRKKKLQGDYKNFGQNFTVRKPLRNSTIPTVSMRILRAGSERKSVIYRKIQKT